MEPDKTPLSIKFYKVFIICYFSIPIMGMLRGCLSQEYLFNNQTREDRKTTGKPESTVIIGKIAEGPIIIYYPIYMQEISGGKLEVFCVTQDFPDTTLNVALCIEGGSGASHAVCGTEDNVLAQGIATMDPPEMWQSDIFHGSLTYQVEQPMTARLVVYTTSPHAGSVEYSSSVTVILNP